MQHSGGSATSVESGRKLFMLCRTYNILSIVTAISKTRCYPLVAFAAKALIEACMHLAFEQPFVFHLFILYFGQVLRAAAVVRKCCIHR